MYFSNFPVTFYSIDDREKVLATDFIKAIKIDPILKNDYLYSDPYTVSDNETPEIISHKVYGNVMYHWVIMLVNECFDPYNDFPKSDDIIQKNTIREFGSLYGIHHYEDSSGNIVDGIGYSLSDGIANNLQLAINYSEPDSTLFREIINNRMLGDIDGDGFLTTNDYNLLVQYMNNTLTNESAIAYMNQYFIPIIFSDKGKYSRYIKFIESSDPSAIPVTNYEYMTNLNESKRVIRILKKEVLAEFVQRYLSMITA